MGFCDETREQAGLKMPCGWQELFLSPCPCDSFLWGVHSFFRVCYLRRVKTTTKSRQLQVHITEEVKWSESHSVVCSSLRPHGLNSPWNSPGQDSGVGSLSLLQGIFPIQGSNQVSRIAGGFFTNWATWEAHYSLLIREERALPASSHSLSHAKDADWLSWGLWPAVARVQSHKCSDWLSQKQEPTHGPWGQGVMIGRPLLNNLVESVEITFVVVKEVPVP